MTPLPLLLLLLLLLLPIPMAIQIQHPQKDLRQQQPIFALLLPAHPTARAPTPKTRILLVDNSATKSPSPLPADCEEEVEGEVEGEGEEEEADEASTVGVVDGGDWQQVSGEVNSGRGAGGGGRGNDKGRGSGTSTASPGRTTPANTQMGQCLLQCMDSAKRPSVPPSMSREFCPCWGSGAGLGTSRKAGGTSSLKTTTEPFYYEYEAAPDITQFGPCNVSVIIGQAQRIVVDLLFYSAAAWVPFWAFLSICVNMSFRQFGHHRWLDFYQELGFILLFPFMGIFVLKPQLELFCVITTLVLLFCLVFVLVIGFLQAYFASSLIKGSSLKDGRLPVAVNYVWPLVLAALPVGIAIWSFRPDIGTNRVHCFVPILSDLFWVFTVPAWMLWLFVLLRNQLSITACKQSRPTVDREQLYWARKSVKGIPLLLCCFLLTFFTQLFAVDLQLLWLCVLFFVESLFLGPLLFLLHTYNHQKVNNGIYERTQMGFYRPCPVRRQLATSGPGPVPLPVATEAGVDPGQTVLPGPVVTIAPVPPPARPLATTVGPLPVVQPIPAASQPQSILKRTTESSKSGEEEQKEGGEAGSGPAGGGGEANAQQFYEWLTDSDERNLRESERVLWPPRHVG